MRGAAIAVRELRHTYAGVTALEGVTLDLPAGGFTALLGRNGAGKTTLVLALCGLVRPAGGDVIVGGASTVDSPRAVRGQLGIVFQDPALDARLTARENLDFHARLYGVPRRERRARVRDALATVGLADRADARAGTLSRGLKRRLEIARALTPAPRVLVLDEPTTGLDVQSRHRIWAGLDALRARTGVTLLHTTHRMDEAGDADRVAVLDRGRLCALDTPDALRARSGGGALRLTLTDADTAAEAAARLPGVSRRSGATLWLADGDREAVRAALLRDPAVWQGVTSLDTGAPSLEDAFLDLTGHERVRPRMRDALIRLRHDLAAAHAVWRREVIRMARDRGQLVGAVSRPVLWVVIFGLGLSPYLGAGFTGAPVGYVAYILPAIVALNILYPAAQAALGTVWERDAGVLRALLAAPAPPWAIFAGKLAGAATIAVAQGLVVLLLAPVAGVSVTPGGVLAALLPMAALALAFGALALALAARMRSVVGFGVFANTLILPAFFLAGSIFPVAPAAGAAALPDWLLLLVHINPVTYAVDELRWALIGYRQLDPVLARGVLAAFTVIPVAAAAATAFRR